MDLSNKTVCIIGAARSGIATARFVLSHGARVNISDAQPLSVLQERLGDLADNERVSIEAGEHTRSFVTEADLLVLSPGVWKDALPVQWAQAADIPVINEIELASRYCDKPIIAVTGSNGKTTTVTLIAQVLEAAGKHVSLCGNIGTPFIEEVGRGDVDFFVLEVSSFQLEWIDQFHPHIAVFLNFSQNHLDRHVDLDDYFNAKARLFMNQDGNDYVVLNAFDERVRSLEDAVKAKACFFNEADKSERHVNPNYLAVMEIASILDIDFDVCHQVFDAFKGVEHRLEYVGQIDGVDFINDSKSTTVEAGRWALQSLQKPAVMICGGRDKNSDFSVLTDLVKQKVKQLIVIGEAKEKLTQTFSNTVPVSPADSLEQAVDIARQHASAGDVVLFSPMCASFDMFKNYEERGGVFKNVVNVLKR